MDEYVREQRGVARDLDCYHKDFEMSRKFDILTAIPSRETMNCTLVLSDPTSIEKC